VDSSASDGDGFWLTEEIDQVQIISTNLDQLEGAGDSDPTQVHAIIMPIEEGNLSRIELYDSEATQYISPYKNDFHLYKPFPSSVLLNAANQQHFPALGSSTLVIYVLNGNSFLKLTLHNVLHAPSVSFTLMSLSALDVDGY
jgi:hypothetical protein